MYKFPAGGNQDAANLLDLLGSFWASTYAGGDQVAAYCDGVARAAEQAHLDLLECVAAVARETVPVFHTENWTVLYALESQVTRGRVAAFGDAGLAYDGSFAYGVPSEASGLPASAKLADVTLAFNRITNPSRTWVRGVDFTVAGGTLFFAADPFADPLLPTRVVFDADGNPADREAAIWLFRGQFDWEHAYTQFGYALGLRMASSEGYRELINAVLDGITGGTAAAQIGRALAAITGTPLVREATETVEFVFNQPDALVVATDAGVYRFAPSAAPLVAPGDVVHAGDPLCDALRVEPLNRGTIPAGLAALAAGPGFLAGGYYADLAFADKVVPLVVEPGVLGRTRVSFEVSGFPGDVAAFWDETHRRGVASGTTLADLLDVRGPVHPTEPTAASLPATVNPLGFLLANVFRANCFLVRVDAGSLGPGAVGLDFVRSLRRVMPPHEAMILAVALPAAADSVSMGSADELLGTFAAAEILEDTVDPAALVAGGPIDGRVVGGSCR